MQHHIVELSPWITRFARDCGFQRYRENLGVVNDRPDYVNRQRLVDAITGNVCPALCECSTAFYTNQFWNGPYWRPSEHNRANILPDVGKNICVRWTRSMVNTIPAYESEARAGYVIVQAYTDFQLCYGPSVVVTLLGYVYAAQVWEMGEQRFAEKRVLSQEFLRDVEELK